jgi:protoporphyrin/coproporphyrin ferrochelatase
MSAAEKPTGVLLLNVGTPDAPGTRAVRRYLREFLSDPRVVDMNPVGRFLLLNLVILPFRPARSAEAYRKIWTADGSPLLVHGIALRDRLAAELGSNFAVALGMRYGSPSIAAAMDELRDRGCERVVVFPLFPQNAGATTGSAVDAVERYAARTAKPRELSVVPSFYGDPGFIDAFARNVRAVLDESPVDHVLFSFHGLPERQILKADPSGAHCLKSDTCCDAVVPANRDCYRAQCFESARLLSRALGLEKDAWSLAFQSRLGRIPWIGPATDEVVLELARRGVRNLVVACPAFVADCLETLEEIGLRAAESFQEAGGATLRLVPSLNASETWVDAAVRLVRQAAGRA